MTQTAVPGVPTATASMRDRVPAQHLLEQVLLHQAAAHPRTRLERVLGLDPVEPEARTWYAGATGERTVAARLSTLPTGWTVLHSLPVGRNGADIDHLIVGPGGVFTVSTTDHADASVWVAGRTVLAAGTGPMIQKAEGEARRVDRVVAGVLADPPAVRPIVAIVGAKRITVRRTAGICSVMRAEHLRRFLRNQPERLTAAEVDALVTAFESPETWQPTLEAGPELLFAFTLLAREVRTAARIRLAWAAGLLGVTAAASTAIVVPGLLSLLAS